MRIFRISQDNQEEETPPSELLKDFLKKNIERYCQYCGEVNPKIIKDQYGFKKCKKCGGKIQIRQIKKEERYENKVK
jgi:translation initiation factor 2 beta subunit (eIF-2beta)/eIF-5